MALIVLFAALKRLPESLKAAEIAAELGSQFGMVAKAAIKHQEGDHSEALQLASQAYEAGCVTAASIAGSACMMLGKEPEAMDWLARALDHDPNDGGSHLWLSVALARRGDRGDAWLHAKMAAELGESAAFQLAGIGEVNLGDPDVAVGYLKKVSQLDENGEALAYLGYALAKTGHSEESLRYMKRGAELGNEKALLYLEKWKRAQSGSELE